MASLEGLLESLEMQPPDLDAMEEEMHRERIREEAGAPPREGPPESVRATAGALMGLPAFVQALTLEGVDAGARVVAPLMAQLNQQAHSLAAQLGLPAAKGDTQGDSSNNMRSAQGLNQLLHQRREFLLLLNSLERRLLMVGLLLLPRALKQQ